jgi:IclR family KDG regulon transcriptional repressor
LKQKPAAEQPNQTLAKALEVFDAFSTEHIEWGIRELARELEINPATVYRIVRTLCNKGYLEQNSINQSYFLGPKVLKLANLYTIRNPLSSVAKKVFESFADRFEHNLYLGMLSQYEMIYLAVSDGRGPVKIAVEPGLTLPLHSNAIGKVLLAYEDDKSIQEYLEKNPLKAFTPRTLSRPEDLIKQLKEIRERGYAINDGEQFDSVGAVAVPLFGQKGQPVNLGISLTYPRHLIYDGSLNIDELIALGREIASEITHRCDVSNWSAAAV